MKDNTTREITIRPCTQDDLPHVLKLMQQLNEFSHNDQTFSPDRFGHTFTEMEKNPEVYQNLVCEQGHTIVGFMSLMYYQSFMHRVGSAQINELVVADTARGQGIGKKLVEYAIAEARARGMDEIEVSTEPDNHRAIAFYKKAGFNEEYVLLGREF